MPDEDFCWRVEEACLNAWPSPRELVLGRWLLRAAGGPSRRLNGVTPLRAHRYPTEAVLARAAPVYAALGRPLVVRAPALATGLAADLARQGFVPQAESCTLFRPLDGVATAAGPGVVVSPTASPDWLALRALLQGGDPATARVLEAVLAAVLLPCAFARIPAPEGTGAAAAGAFGVVDRDLLVLEAVGTHPDHRYRGHGAAVVAALTAWGRRQGATGACLQVLADNAAGRRLYERLGFTRDLYRYVHCAREGIG